MGCRDIYFFSTSFFCFLVCGGYSFFFCGQVGLLGDSQIGKTSLMVNYVEGMFEESYIETLGVHFMDKTITLKNNKITFNIWDLGGSRVMFFCVCILLK